MTQSLSVRLKLAWKAAAILLAVVFVTAAPSNASTLFGVRYGKDGWQMQKVADLERWSGKRAGVVLLFTNFCNDGTTVNNLFSTQLPNIWNSKHVPVVSWEPFICSSSNTPYDIEGRIANGQYDSYLYAWADRMKKWLAGPDGVYGTGDDRRAYIRFAHEMNGSWYPWSATGSGETYTKYIAMWQRVHNIFDAKGMGPTHLQWIWCPNATDASGYKAEYYYPGNGYVDWIGVDGYNFGTNLGKTWKTPAQVFDSIITRMRALTAKPIGFMETGSSAKTSAGMDVYAKNKWLESLYSYAINKNVKMVVYFNMDSTILKPCCPVMDWSIFGGGWGDVSYTYGTQTYKAFSSYGKVVKWSQFIGTDKYNLRLMTDDVFKGNF